MNLGITVFLTDGELGPAELARAAEERGFSSLYLPHHTHLPLRADTPPSLVGGVNLDDYKRGIDPLVGLAFAAGATAKLRLGTGVLLAAQLEPISLAKQLATLDHLSGGRVVLGVGAGWNRAEAADHGIDFASRRAVLREHVLCLRAIWRDEVAEFHGEYLDLPPCWSWPKPLSGCMPILLGGGAGELLWQAICEFGDGWLPIGGAGLSRSLPELRGYAERAGRDPDSLSVVPFGVIGDAGKLDYYEALGLGEIVLRLQNGARDEMLRELDSLAGLLSGR